MGSLVSLHYSVHCVCFCHDASHCAGNLLLALDHTLDVLGFNFHLVPVLFYHLRSWSFGSVWLCPWLRLSILAHFPNDALWRILPICGSGASVMHTASVCL